MHKLKSLENYICANIQTPVFARKKEKKGRLQSFIAKTEKFYDNGTETTKSLTAMYTYNMHRLHSKKKLENRCCLFMSKSGEKEAVGKRPRASD